MKVLRDIIGFNWDEGNKGKNVKKHGITDEESEDAFFDPEKKILKDILHSGKEDRYILLGRTRRDKLLFIVFTVRDQKIRIISSRSLKNKERNLYEKEA